jgi:methyl-accepting chemotaxis protein
VRIPSSRRGGDVLEQVTTRLDSLDSRCAAELVAGLEAMQTGDLTHRVTPVTTLMDERSGDPAVDAIAESLDALILKVQSAVTACNAVTGDYSAPLGDRSSGAPLQARLESLTDNCLTGLTEGLAKRRPATSRRGSRP